MKEWIKEIGIGLMISGIFFFSLFGPGILRGAPMKEPERYAKETEAMIDREEMALSSIGGDYEIPHVTAVEAETVRVPPIEVPGNIKELTEKAGERYGIAPEFLQAIAWRESRFQPDAVNAAGTCFGIMQVSEKWHSHRLETGENLMDPETNIRVAAEYLKELFERYQDPEIVLMIYNGDKRALEEGYISRYAKDILELSEKLEGEEK